MQERQVGWSAMGAAAGVALALVTGQAAWLALGGVTTVLALWLAWQGRAERAITAAALGATALVTVQALLPPSLRWGNGLVLLGLLLVAALATRWGSVWQTGNHEFRRLVGLAAALAYGGAQITFLARSGGPLPDARLAEAGVVGALAAVVFWLLRRALARQHQPLVRRLALALTFATSLYAALVFAPWWGGSVTSDAARLVASVGVWALAVALGVAVLRLPNKAPHRQPLPRRRDLPGWRVTLNDYLTLMKVRVASLLLVTTLGGMIIAAGGWPGWTLVGWVMLGGLLSVGGAGALNHYLDRDIDVHMGRTSQRPIPSGRVPARHALLFGLVLSVVQFAVFWFFVNPVAAWLSLGGLVYYVLIYTIWLKRTSTQNIVIGGAAGAFPPLVGWAAVTGNLSLGALFLFAIVFYWTPPHFWALALMRKSDYARAGVPMLPVVHGEQATRVQIVLYTIMMVVLTLLLVPLRLMGIVYLGAALLLNARFLWDAVRLYREPTNQHALTLYKYSLLYLALLFLAMAVDRSLVV